MLLFYSSHQDDEEVIEKANQLMSAVCPEMPPPARPVSTGRAEKGKAIISPHSRA